MNNEMSLSNVSSNDRVQALVKEVKEGVAKIQSSDDWKACLDMSSKFWKYSFHNQMLIMLQKRDATYVAGFYKWKEFSRWVKKGEHGIRILAPLIVKAKGQKNGEEEITLKGFRAVSVFDASQTEGKELPSVFHSLKGSAPEGVFEKLLSFTKNQGYTIGFQEITDGSYGYLNKQKEIVLKLGESTAQTMETLCHELAHGLLGHLTEKELGRDEKELEAETTAWIVCRNLGLETRETSFGYLATWTQEKERDAKLEKAAHKACEIAKKVLEGLEKVEMAG